MLLIGIVFALFGGIFYAMLLKEHGAKRIKYWQVTAVLVIILVMAYFIGGDNGVGFTIFGMIIGGFVLGIGFFIQEVGGNVKDNFQSFDGYVRKETQERRKTDKNLKYSESYYTVAPQENRSHYTKYGGTAFHLASIVIILSAMFNFGKFPALRQATQYIENTAIFQIKSTVMLLLLSFTNPFVTINFKDTAVGKFLSQNFSAEIFLFNPNFQLIVKSALSAVILIYFLGKNYFLLPWKSGIFIVILYMCMVIYFLGHNLYRLIYFPKEFRMLNIVRLKMFFLSIHPVIFTGAILVFSIIFFGTVLNWDLSQVNSELIFLLAFNIVMAHISWRIANR